MGHSQSERGNMLRTLFTPSWGRLLRIAVPVLIVIAVMFGFRDPFDFDDRPHVERLLKLAINGVQSDIAVDVEECLRAQVKLGEVGNLEGMSELEWQATAKLYLSQNPGYESLQLLDRNYHYRRSFILPDASGLLASLDYSSDPRLQSLLRMAEAATSQVAALRIGFESRSPVYLIAVPTVAQGKRDGFLVVAAAIDRTLDSLLSEFKNLGYSMQVTDSTGPLYWSGTPENREKWGQRVKIPITAVEWQVEVWPKPETLREARSPSWELAALFFLLLLLLLASTLHFAHVARIKSAELSASHDDLERRIRERTAELEESNHALQNLSASLLYAQDEERRRIARELHDSTAQNLTAIKINLSNLRKSAGAGSKSFQLLDQSCQFADQVLTEVRSLSYILHPPILEDFGLESALPWYAGGFGERSGVHVEVQIDPDFGRLSSELELISFRVVQEALGNIHRHSGSRTAKISLSRDSSNVTLIVSDHGRGLPKEVNNAKNDAVPQVGVGIAGMHERVRQFGGTLAITSSNDGTTVKAVLPLRDSSPLPSSDTGAAEVRT